jgi:hypothetical protein
MSKPVLFYGKPSQLADVLTYAKINFLTNGLTDDQAKAGYLASLFRGSALNWLTQKFVENPNILGDYESFEASVKETFELNEFALQAQSARKLANLRQKGSAQDYALKFKELSRQAGLPDPTAIALFTKGLKRHVRSALIINDERDSLDDAVTEAIRIDSQLYFASPRQGTRDTKGPTRNGKGQFKKSATVKTEQFDY